MKVVRRYATAARLAKGHPVIQITGPGGSTMWVVFNGKPTTKDIAQTEVAILREGRYCGHVRLRELDRLGNANLSPSRDPIGHEAFPTIERKVLNDEEETVTD